MFVINTEKLYYKDSYLREFTAIVIDCIETKDCFEVVLDKTAFYPVGGGQPWDTGTINDLEVLAVNEQNDIIMHRLKEPLKKGSLVSCCVNWQDRFYLMQEHTGEHIVSGLIKKHHGLNNIGFHMGCDYMTIDIDGIIKKEDISVIERLANEAVYRNIPVVSRFVRPDELAGIDFRSKKDFTEDVRIVSIEGYDTCACCGTHVSTTGEIGIIKITDCSKYKKGMRLFMLCGFRAYKDYCEKNEHAHNISELLSSKLSEITSAVKLLLDENAELRRQLTAYKKERLTQIAESIHSSDTICVFEDNLSNDDLRILSMAISEKARLVAAFSESEGAYRYAVCSKHIDVRPITAKLNEHFSGKGGGKSNITGGFVSGCENDIKDFFSSL